MWDKVGEKGKLPFEKNEVATNEKQVDLEEEKKKRKTFLKYNRGKNGIFGDKNEPELIEKEV
jgi:hypothetical protein